MNHFNWFQLIPGVGHEYAGVVTAAVTAVCLLIFGVVARIKLKTGSNCSEPAGKLSVKGIFEVFTELIVSLADMVIGHEGMKFVPLFATIFTYILVNNLVGLLPGMSASTQDLNATLPIGIFSFIMYNYYGVKEHGLKYLKQFLGPLLLLAPLMLPIELVSHVVRPFSLGLRLYGNMTGDHTVLGAFFDLAPYGVPVIFYFLGLFISFVQAFVFTLLSMVYISMATSHDH